jgi:hypothetical protein
VQSGRGKGGGEMGEKRQFLRWYFCYKVMRSFGNSIYRSSVKATCMLRGMRVYLSPKRWVNRGAGGATAMKEGTGERW